MAVVYSAWTIFYIAGKKIVNMLYEFQMTLRAKHFLDYFDQCSLSVFSIYLAC